MPEPHAVLLGEAVAQEEREGVGVLVGLLVAQALEVGVWLVVLVDVLVAEELGDCVCAAQGVGVLVAQVDWVGDMEGLPEEDCVDDRDCDRVMLAQVLGVRLGEALVLPVRDSAAEAFAEGVAPLPKLAVSDGDALCVEVRGGEAETEGDPVTQALAAADGLVVRVADAHLLALEVWVAEGEGERVGVWVPVGERVADVHCDTVALLLALTLRDGLRVEERLSVAMLLEQAVGEGVTEEEEEGETVPLGLEVRLELRVLVRLGVPVAQAVGVAEGEGAREEEGAPLGVARAVSVRERVPETLSVLHGVGVGVGEALPVRLPLSVPVPLPQCDTVAVVEGQPEGVRDAEGLPEADALCDCDTVDVMQGVAERVAGKLVALTSALTDKEALGSELRDTAAEPEVVRVRVEQAETVGDCVVVTVGEREKVREGEADGVMAGDVVKQDEGERVTLLLPLSVVLRVSVALAVRLPLTVPVALLQRDTVTVVEGQLDAVRDAEGLPEGEGLLDSDPVPVGHMEVERVGDAVPETVALPLAEDRAD